MLKYCYSFKALFNNGFTRTIFSVIFFPLPLCLLIGLMDFFWIILNPFIQYIKQKTG